MDKVLESTPFAFSVEFAAIAARRDFLNLEKWLQDNLTIHRDSFFQVQNWLLLMVLLSNIFDVVVLIIYRPLRLRNKFT